MGISRLRQYALSILLTVWSVVFPGTLHAQLTACTAEGVVRDTTGAAISYAVVSVFPELSEGATTGQAVTSARCSGVRRTQSFSVVTSPAS